MLARDTTKKVKTSEVSEVVAGRERVGGQQQAARRRPADSQLRARLQQLSSKVDAESYLARSLAKLVQATRNKCATLIGTPASGPTFGQQKDAPGGPVGEPLRRSHSLDTRAGGRLRAPMAPPPANARSGLIPSLISAAAVKSAGKPEIAGRPKKCTDDTNNKSAIKSLLSAAAAARRRQRMPALARGTKFLFALAAVVALSLSQGLQAAPIGQWTETILPNWLPDGLMAVSDSSSAGASGALASGAPAQEQQIEDIGNLIDRMREDNSGGQQRQQQPMKRNWFALTDKQERQLGADEPQVGARPAGDHFWIERRRLNRDRALEPPAWLRDRPIRRDQRIQILEPVEVEEMPAVREMADEVRPIGQRSERGRRSRRSSSELYEDILHHLIEEAIEGRQMLDDFYQQLEVARSNSQQQQQYQKQQQQQLRGAPQSFLNQNIGDASLADGQVEAKTRTTGQGDGPALLRNSQESVDQTLMVAGDEISGDEDDDNDDGALADSAPASQLQRAPVMAAAQKWSQAPAEPLKQEASGGYALDDSIGSGMQSSQVGGDGLAELMAAAAPLQQQVAELEQSIAAPSEDSFHVIEDIDQADASQEIPLADSERPQASSASSLQSSGAAPVLQLVDDSADSPRLERRNNLFGLDGRRAAPQLVRPKSTGWPTRLNSTTRAPLVAAAVELIRGGFLARPQLRTHLDGSLQSPRGVARQQLVELDMAAPLERAQLARKFDSLARDPRSPGLGWPADTSEDPFMMDVLEALRNIDNTGDDGDDEQDDRRERLAQMSRQQRKSAAGALQQTNERQLEPVDFSGAAANELDFYTWTPRRPVQLGVPPTSELATSWRDLYDRPAQAGPRGQPTLAALATYLGAIYALGQRERAAGVAEVAPALPAILSQLHQNITAAQSAHSGRMFDSAHTLSYIIVLLAALASTYLIVKFAARKLDGRTIERRTRDLSAGESSAGDPHDSDDIEKIGRSSCAFTPHIWPFGKQRTDSEDTIRGKTSASGAGLALDEANVDRRDKCLAGSRNSIDSGHETIATLDSDLSSRTIRMLRNNMEALGARWARLMSGRAQGSAFGADERQADGEKGAAAAKESVGATFRTSASYIRSLIEALANSSARATASSSTAQMSTQTSRATLNADGEPQSLAAAQKLFRDDGGEGEILMSQMDISAAHLILDYMEKHLIDKERLRREWLELNAGAGPGEGRAGHRKGGGSRAANQLALQRLAKVALSAENLHKNRDASVVPFDRNRVRLGACPRQLAGGSAHKLRDSGGGRGGQPKVSSDYINASFIHDDDPRRPTHIIAQGPQEDTCGQFWQMIWEQEISLIVMLTRLNEKGQPMCACYWPTSVAAATPHTAGLVQAGGRRASVTSVFSGSPNSGSGGGNGNGANGLGSPHNFHHHHHQMAPIVATGEPNDNVLSFEVPLASHPTEATDCADSSDRPTATRLEVHLISEHVSSSDYLVRNMYLVNTGTGETRTISQFHYLAWLQGRTPENVRSFLQFRRKVHKSYRNLKAPILVHCSDGGGRSGTYALIDIILERIRNGAKEIDLRATLEHLRDQRVGLCETQSQFEFVLVALAEEIQIILEALPQ